MNSWSYCVCVAFWFNLFFPSRQGYAFGGRWATCKSYPGKFECWITTSQKWQCQWRQYISSASWTWHHQWWQYISTTSRKWHCQWWQCISTIAIYVLIWIQVHFNFVTLLCWVLCGYADLSWCLWNSKQAYKWTDIIVHQKGSTINEVMNHIGCIFFAKKIVHLICSIRITGTLSSPACLRKNWHVVFDNSFPEYHTLFMALQKLPIAMKGAVILCQEDRHKN